MRRLYEALLESSILFSFLSGALISLAGSLATSALLWTAGLPVSRATLNWLALLLALSSVGFFWAGSAMEMARRVWVAQGSDAKLRSKYVERNGRRHFLFGLLLAVLCILCFGLVLVFVR